MTMSRWNPMSLPLLLVLTSLSCGYLPESERETLNSLLRVMVQSVHSSEGPPNPSVHLALRLASSHHLPTEVLLLQQLKMTAVEKVKHGEDFSSGLVALYTLAMAASCHNPTDVSYKGERIDLVEILQQKLTKEIEHIGKTTFPLSNYYQVSLDVLTLCMIDAEISQNIVQILIDAVMNDKFTYGSEFSVDTGAVAALALRCMIDRKTTIHISNALNHILEQILSRITDDGLIGNLYSTGLAIQALSVNSDRVAPGHWNRTKSVGRLLSGILEGSFANPQAASQIVPSLEGRSYLDVTRLNCAEDCSNLTFPVSSTSPPPTTQGLPITVEYHIVDGLTHSFSDAASVSMPGGSPLIRVLERARDLYPDRFSFSITQNLWGPSLTTVHGLTASSQNRTYWQLLSGSKPLDQGIGDYKPKDGEQIFANYSHY